VAIADLIFIPYPSSQAHEQVGKVILWQSNGKAKKISRVLLRLDVPRGFRILVSVRFDFAMFFIPKKGDGWIELCKEWIDKRP
jgi:hypothetical protein